MRKTNVCLNVFCLILFLFASAGFAAAQHEGHDTSGTAPTAEGSLPRSKGDETPCQRVARLTAELDQDFDGLLGVPDPGELQKRLADHKVKLQQLRATTEACSQQCEKPPKRKRKGCGHMMAH